MNQSQTSRRWIPQSTAGFWALALLALLCWPTYGHCIPVSCSCAPVASHPKTKASKETVSVHVEERRSYWKSTGQAILLPFRAVGTGIYYVVQGPRMLAELIAFGNRGESFAKMDSCNCPRGHFWHRYPKCPNTDECWVPPTN